MLTAVLEIDALPSLRIHATECTQSIVDLRYCSRAVVQYTARFRHTRHERLQLALTHLQHKLS